MVKHKIKNIANRALPVDGTNFIPESGQIVEAEITPRLKNMIQNRFFEDLGEVIEEKKAIEEKKELIEEEAKPDFVGYEDTPTTTKKGRKKKKKPKKLIEGDIYG